MNPTIALILQRNSADIEAIVTKVGIPTLLSLLPNFMNILTTVQAPTPAATSATIPPAVAPKPQTW